MDSRARILVAASGAGRSLINLLEKQEGSNAYEVIGLVSDSAKCLAVQRARERDLPVYIGEFDDSLIAGADLSAWMNALRVDWVVLAGFLKIFPLNFPDQKWRGRIINIHPSLLPAHGGKGMYGARVHQAVIRAGEPESGASVHFASEEYDCGALIAQASLKVLPNEQAESLAKRVFELECLLYPKVLAELVEGSLPFSAGSFKHFNHCALK